MSDHFRYDSPGCHDFPHVHRDTVLPAYAVKVCRCREACLRERFPYPENRLPFSAFVYLCHSYLLFFLCLAFYNSSMYPFRFPA